MILHRVAARLVLPGLVTATLLATPVAAAHAQSASKASGEGAQVVLTGRLELPRGQTVGDVVVFNGPVTVDGTVDGTLTVFNGDLMISGMVTGDVTSFNGSVTLSDSAIVGGDLATRARPTIASGATVTGSRQRVNTEILLGRIRWVSRFAIWLAVSVSTLLLGLLLLAFAPVAAEVVARTAVEGVGASIGWGFALAIGLPLIAVIAIVTVVGIPFGLGTLLALGLIYALGYTASAYALGRAVVRAPASRFLALGAGWGLLRLASLVPVLSGFIWFAASVYGLGMLAASARRRQRTSAPASVLPAPPPPVPPAPVPAP